MSIEVDAAAVERMKEGLVQMSMLRRFPRLAQVAAVAGSLELGRRRDGHDRERDVRTGPVAARTADTTRTRGEVNTESEG
jgi:hypothetical protein